MTKFNRLELLIGNDNLNKLNNKKILIFGIGGVGGYVAESLSRCNIGHIDIVDNDIINESNINRQIIALDSTIGQKKVDIMKQRINDINNKCIVNTFNIFYLPENESLISFKQYDYIIDAIHTIISKKNIIKNAKKNNIPIISAMGAGNKIDSTKIKITDIYKTKNCPLVKIIRKLCRENNINNLDVAYSDELPINANITDIPSISYMPAIMGLMISNYVIKKIILN